MADDIVTIPDLPLAILLDGSEYVPIAILNPDGSVTTLRTTTGAIGDAGSGGGGGGGTAQIVTASGPVTVGNDVAALILDKPTPSSTPVQLPSVNVRNGLPLTIADIGGNAGDVTVTAAAGESIMGLSQMILTSNGQGAGSAASVTIIPLVAIAGWYFG